MILILCDLTLANRKVFGQARDAGGGEGRARAALDPCAIRMREEQRIESGVLLFAPCSRTVVRSDVKITGGSRYKARLGCRLAFAVALSVCLGSAFVPARAPGATASSVVQASPAPLASAPGELGALIVSGRLSDLRWPNFSDVRADVAEFYALNGNAPAWVHDAAAPTAQALSMIALLKQASLKGLNPEDYDASRWDTRVARLAPATASPAGSDVVHFDLALTICAARYLSALHIGRVNPRPAKFAFALGPEHYDLAQFMSRAMIAAPSVDAAAAMLEPRYDGYRRVETALAAYLKLAAQGDGVRVPMPDKSVHPGGAFAGIAPLAARLHQLGDLASDAPEIAEATNFGQPLVDAVRHFQRRHGLEPDGILGKDTVAQLNVPLGRRVLQLQYALERYRWIPASFPQPPIIINLPEFKLRTMRRQPAPYLTMRVVVGKAYGHQTPVFADDMRYLIFRPYWDVPMSIQLAELVPKIRRDRNYLAANNFEVTTYNGKVVTDGEVDDEVFDKLRSGELVIRQKPGPKNALGLVKFIFPNHYNVYLHSTPVPELFLKPRRDFSHGCIRVQDPVALAAWVLRDKPEWNVDKIRQAMNGDQTIQVNLDKPIPVLILYSTAVVEPDGEVRFFRDIYNYDSKLEQELASGYPFPIPR